MYHELVGSQQSLLIYINIYKYLGSPQNNGYLPSGFHGPSLRDKISMSGEGDLLLPPRKSGRLLISTYH